MKGKSSESGCRRVKESVEDRRGDNGDIEEDERFREGWGQNGIAREEKGNEKMVSSDGEGGGGAEEEEGGGGGARDVGGERRRRRKKERSVKQRQ